MLLLKLLGLVEKLVMASRFGVGATADAALVGATGALLLGYLLQDVVSSALIPVLVNRDRDGQARTTGTLFTIILLVLLVIAALTWWQGRALLQLLAPGFDSETQSLALYVLRSALIGLPALGVGAVLGAHLNANGHYLQPALAELMLRIGPVLGLLLVGGIEGLAFGLAAGALLRLACLIRPGVTPRPRCDLADDGLRRSLDLVWPLLLTSIISIQLFAMIEAAIASTVGIGVVSALAYARRIADVPIFLIYQVSARVVLPTLAGLAVDRVRLQRTLKRASELTLLLLLPPTVMGMLLAESVVRLIYGRGAFDDAAVAATTTAFWALLPGLPALGLSVIVARFAYALKDTRGPSLIRLGGVILHVALALALRPWGIAGVAWSSTITLWIEALALVLLVAFRLGIRWDILRAGWRSGVRLSISAGLMLAVAMQLNALLPPVSGVLPLVARLAVISSAGLVVYTGSLLLFGVRLRFAGST